MGHSLKEYLERQSTEILEIILQKETTGGAESQKQLCAMIEEILPQRRQEKE
jgi:hypothetical protein